MLRFKAKELSFIISIWYFRKHAQAESNLHKRYPCRLWLSRNENSGLQGSFEPRYWGCCHCCNKHSRVLVLGKAVVWQREKKQQLSAQPLAGTKCTGQSSRTGETSFPPVWPSAGDAFKLWLQHAVSVLLTLISSFLSPVPFLSSAWNVSWGFDSFYLIISSFCMEDCWAPYSEVTTSLEFLNICLPSYLLWCQTLDISLPSAPHPVSVVV